MIPSNIKRWPEKRGGFQGLLLGRLLIALFLVVLVTLHQVLKPGQSPDLIILAYAILGALFGASLLVSIFFPSEQNHFNWGMLHLFIDTLAVSLWLSLGNAPSSPVIFIYLVIELLAAVVFLSKGAFFSALMASVCYAWVLGSTAGVTTDTILSWSIYTLIFAIVGLVGGYLSEELKRTSDRLMQKNQEIQQLTQLFEGIIEGMPTGLLTLDEEMNIAFLNPGAETILNKQRAQLVGRSLKNEVPDLLPFFEALSAEKIEDESDELVQSGIETELTSTGTEWHRSVFLKAMLGKGEARLQQTVELGNGKTKRILRGDVAVLPIGSSSSSLFSQSQGIGRVLLFQDVTKLVHLEDKLKQNEKMAAVGQLAAGIAHEIRNPLASMSASIQMLQTGVDPKSLEPENRRLMEIIVKEVDRLNDLISDFLDFVKPEKFKMEAVSLQGLLSELVFQVSQQKEKIATIQIDTQLSPDISALGSEEKLKQVAWNLLTNALQAIKTSGKIEVGCESVSPHWVCFWVKDSGEGMSEEVLQHLYEPFFTTKPRGTGLGLATVYKIIEAHHGEIRVQSKVGQGTRFEVHLPKA